MWAAVTPGGTLPPMPEVIRLAKPVYHYLAVFDNDTQLPLYLGHTRTGGGQELDVDDLRRGAPSDSGAHALTWFPFDYRLGKVACSALRSSVVPAFMCSCA